MLMSRGWEEFTDDPGRVIAFYKSEDQGAELSAYRKAWCLAGRAGNPRMLGGMEVDIEV